MATRLNVLERRFEGPLAQRLTAAASSMGITLYFFWSGGICHSSWRPTAHYRPLSLGHACGKIRGDGHPAQEDGAPPVDPAGLGGIDLVLITHHHTDHMDPGTLAPLAQLHPDLRFVAPRASRAEALKRTGATNDRLIPVDAGQLIEPWPGLSIVALRAAHETLETDIEGNQRFLGYALTFREEGRDVSIIHSGDTIPFAGQGEEYRRARPDLLCCPSMDARKRLPLAASPAI